MEKVTRVGSIEVELAAARPQVKIVTPCRHGVAKATDLLGVNVQPSSSDSPNHGPESWLSQAMAVWAAAKDNLLNPTEDTFSYTNDART